MSSLIVLPVPSELAGSFISRGATARITNGVRGYSVAGTVTRANAIDAEIEVDADLSHSDDWSIESIERKADDESIERVSPIAAAIGNQFDLFAGA